jgi:cardiolipin synthase
MFLVPLFALVYFSGIPNASYIALSIFILAGFTDILDGYIARKYDFVTAIGTVIDPLADKMMQLTAISCLAISNAIPIWMMVILIIKELWMIISGIYMYFHKVKTVVSANWFGKSATVLLSLGIFLIIILPESMFSYYVMVSAIVLKFIAFSSYVKHYIQNIRPKMKESV